MHYVVLCFLAGTHCKNGRKAFTAWHCQLCCQKTPVGKLLSGSTVLFVVFARFLHAFSVCVCVLCVCVCVCVVWCVLSVCVGCVCVCVLCVCVCVCVGVCVLCVCVCALCVCVCVCALCVCALCVC